MREWYGFATFHNPRLLNRIFPLFLTWVVKHVGQQKITLQRFVYAIWDGCVFIDKNTSNSIKNCYWTAHIRHPCIYI